jgi:hypothetical protein
MRRTLEVATIPLVAAIAAGCDSEFQPNIVTELIVNSQFVEYTEENVLLNHVPWLDGRANNVEWGSPVDPARPYTYVQLSADDGFGNPGTSKYIAVKSAYTAEWDPVDREYELRNIYFLFQWYDLTPSQYKDSFVYVGEDLEILQPQILQYFESIDDPDVPDEQEPAFDLAATDDSLATYFFNLETDKAKPENWEQRGGDDRLALIFGGGEARGGGGRTFEEFGCQIACHSGSFGELESGFLDAWLWSASRANRLEECFNRDDVGGDVDPREKLCGYADDYGLSTAGLVQDEGPVLWVPNFDPSLPRDRRIPARIWRLEMDQNGNSTGAGACQKINMGMPFPWLHRYTVESAYVHSAWPRRGLWNERPINWDTLEPEQPRYWSPGDFVAGYAMGHDLSGRSSIEDRFTFCLACCNRTEGERNCATSQGEAGDFSQHFRSSINTRARGEYDFVSRHWLLETARSAISPWGNSQGDPDYDDWDFEDLLSDSPRELVMAISVWDQQEEAHWGTKGIRLRFAPPPPREGR